MPLYLRLDFRRCSSGVLSPLFTFFELMQVICMSFSPAYHALSAYLAVDANEPWQLHKLEQCLQEISSPPVLLFVFP